MGYLRIKHGELSIRNDKWTWTIISSVSNLEDLTIHSGGFNQHTYVDYIMNIYIYYIQTAKIC